MGAQYAAKTKPGGGRKSRTDAKGRSKGLVHRVLIVRRSLVHSPQFSALSCSARALFFELHAMFNGTNNGEIFLSVRDATARLGFSDFKAAMAAFAELTQLGFIRETAAGSFSIKASDLSRARAWNLNWIGRDAHCVGSDAITPVDYSSLNRTQKRRVEGRQKVLAKYLKDYQRGQFAVEDSSTMAVRMAVAESISVGDSKTLNSGNGGKPVIGIVGESSTHLEYHRGAGIEADQCRSDCSMSDRVASRRRRLHFAVSRPGPCLPDLSESAANSPAVLQAKSVP